MVILWKLAGPPGYAPTLTVCRDDTDAVLGSVAMTESATAKGHYTGGIEVGSYSGKVKAFTTSPKGTYYGNTSDGQLQDFVSSAMQAISGGVVDTIRDGKTLWIGFVGETSKTVTTPDYSATTIKVVVEHKTSGASYVLGITAKTSNSITFTVPSEIYSQSGEWIYAIKTSADFVLHHGDYLIKRTAI